MPPTLGRFLGGFAAESAGLLGSPIVSVAQCAALLGARFRPSAEAVSIQGQPSTTRRWHLEDDYILMRPIGNAIGNIRVGIGAKTGNQHQAEISSSFSSSSLFYLARPCASTCHISPS